MFLSTLFQMITRTLVVAGVFALVSQAVQGAELGAAIPLAPHGDALQGSAGSPLPLTPRSWLVAVEGPNGTPTDADDLVLLVTDADGTQTVTPLATPSLPDFSPNPLRLSATRALALSAGPDSTFQTADDAIHLLDDLGGANTVTTIPVGFLTDQHQSAPVLLTADRVAIAALGPDGATGTADDELVILSDLGGANRVTPLAAPFLTVAGSGRPTALSPTSLVIQSAGPDATQRSADDVLYVFRDLDGVAERTEVAVPFGWHDGRTGIPKRITATRALLASSGPDGLRRTADDEVNLVSELDGTPTVVPTTVPFLQFEAADVLMVAPDLAVVVTSGPDGTPRTADDELAILGDLLGTPSLSAVTVGPIATGANGRPVPLTDDRVVLSGAGPDLTVNTPDDEVVVVSDLRTSPAALPIPVGALGLSANGLSAALGADALLVNHGGVDALDAGADAVALVTGLGGVPEIESEPIPGGVGDASSNFVFVPQPLGDGRAVQVRRGATALGDGADDLMQLIEDLPAERGLDVSKLVVKFDPEKPQKGERISVKAVVRLDGLPLPETMDVTVSLGNVSQTLPADLFTRGKNAIRYKDRKGKRGFVRKLTWKPAKGKLAIKGKGAGTGLAGLDPGYLPIALEYGGVYLSAAPAGEAVRKGIKFKAP